MGGEETNSVLLSVVLSLVVLGAIAGTLVLFGTETISSGTPADAADSLDRLGANDGTDNDAITTETDHSVNASTDADEDADADADADTDTDADEEMDTDTDEDTDSDGNGAADSPDAESD